jgi:hypothetical protein
LKAASPELGPGFKGALQRNPPFFQLEDVFSPVAPHMTMLL